MQLATVDYIIIGILLVSGMIAWHRGFLKESLSVSSWLIAALGSVFFWPITKPFTRALVQPNFVADALALVGFFFLVLIPVSFVSFRLMEMVRGTRAGPLDKSMGFVFGLGRGLLIVGLGYVIFSWLSPEKTQPDWIKEARLMPVVRGTADMLLSLGTKSTAKGEEKKEKTAAGKANTPSPVTTKTAETTPADRDTKPRPVPKSAPTEANNEGGEKVSSTSQRYDEEDRRRMNQLVSSHNKP